jgi:hypothetical protein
MSWGATRLINVNALLWPGKVRFPPTPRKIPGENRWRVELQGRWPFSLPALLMPVQLAEGATCAAAAGVEHV